MSIRNKETALIVTSTMLWVAVMFAGWYGKWFMGMFLGLIIMFIYMLMGSAKQGVISKKLLWYPLVSWLVLWSVGFYLAQNYALKFSEGIATFTLFGFHPSFAFIVLFYWVGGVLTLTLGLNLYKDEWLSEAEWETFKQKLAAENERTQKMGIREDA